MLHNDSAEAYLVVSSEVSSRARGYTYLDNKASNKQIINRPILIITKVLIN